MTDQGYSSIAPDLFERDLREKITEGIAFVASSVMSRSQAAAVCQAIWPFIEERINAAESSRRDWAAEALRLEAELERERKRVATDVEVYSRYCDWPECFRSYNVITGPQASGKPWLQINAAGTLILCPDHQGLGHRPKKFHWEQGWKVVQMSCECGAEGNDLVPANTARCKEWWSDHVATVSRPVCAVHEEGQ